MFFLLIVSLLYSIYIFKLFWKRENMRPIMVTTGTQTDDYDSEIDDDGHLDENTEKLDEDPVNVNEIEMKNDENDSFITTSVKKRSSWW